ncbi:thioesterase family protein [Frankia sp. AiPs1]|uniref:acyl-CoA thioesterase n=1 Tax=Frankia sp. AiPs1 TaxID=573493 RepID=UPI002044524B|nr:thioesterase family protein [Frankia sp. AiPs1]MCM3925075.1 thioesterase family protein [Frankia sp. AiPs1]
MTDPCEPGIQPRPAADLPTPLGQGNGPRRAEWSRGELRRDAASLAGMLGLTVDPAQCRGRFVADPHLLNTRGTLWGGCGLAAAIAFVQACGGRDCVWAHIQFLSPVQAGEEVELSVEAGTGGLSQAVVRATAAGRLVFLAGGTFSRVSGVVSRFGPAGDWAPDPDVCPAREYPTWLDFPRDGVISLVEQRWARPARTDLDGRPGGGSSALWLRLRPRFPLDAAVLALLGDFAPVGLIEATGHMAAGTSLDNSLRIVAPPTGEWVLLDVRVEAIVRNVAQVRGRMYDRTGALVATVSQTTLVHRVRPPSPASRDDQPAPAPTAG